MKKSAAVKTILTTALVLVLTLALASAVLFMKSPSTCSGSWTSCSNAFLNDANRATTTPTLSGVWNGYNHNLINGSTINSVTVRADFFASKSNGFLNVSVSEDGGLTYGVGHLVGGNTAEQTFNINVTGDYAWNSDKVNNIKVKATCVKVGGGGTPTCNLDWIPVTVDYTAPCVRANPGVSVLPITQNGSAGSTLLYSIRVFNNDNSCGFSSFNLSSIVPESWQGSFSPQPILNINSFSSGVSNFSITSDANASLGLYSFNVTAVNLNATSYSGTASNATYNVI